jgi:flagellar biosynthesis protein FlhG
MSAKYPKDQAQELREMVNPSQPRGWVIAVASGKGGVGKSNIAANLAIALRALGSSVVLIDVDIGLANADVILGVNKPQFNLRDVIVGAIDVENALTPAPGGIKLLAGSMGSMMVSDLTEDERDDLVECFMKLTASEDFVIIDTGAGISSNVIHFASAADQLIVVTGPEGPMIVNAYELIRTVSREKGRGRIGTVCNLADDRADGEHTCRKIHKTSRMHLDGLHIEMLGHVQRDKKVRLAVKAREPFLLKYPDCPASICIRKLAETVLERAGNAGESKFIDKLKAITEGE